MLQIYRWVIIRDLKKETEQEAFLKKLIFLAPTLMYDLEQFVFVDIFCLWDCGFPYSLFKKIIAFIVFDAFTELFITLAIVVNTVFMALDHYGLEENHIMDTTLKTGNKVNDNHSVMAFGFYFYSLFSQLKPKFLFTGVHDHIWSGMFNEADSYES